MSQRIVVTGAPGYIGQFVVPELVNRGHDVLACTHSTPAEGDAPTATIDVTRVDSMRSVFEQGDIVVHLAARTGPGHMEDPVHDLEINALGTLNVLTAAHAADAARVINLSSYEVYGCTESCTLTEDTLAWPRHPYAASCLTGEHYAAVFCKSYGLPTANLRLFNVYGPGMHETKAKTVIPIFARRILQGEGLTINGGPDTGLDFVYVEDVARAIALAAEHDLEGDTFNIGSGVCTRLADIALNLADMLGTRRPEISFQENAESRAISADIQRASQTLGYAPQTSIEDGLKRYVESDLRT